ncbi:MAG: TIGR00730 family Rossman fold protein [Gemmataceae bacterium]
MNRNKPEGPKSVFQKISDPSDDQEEERQPVSNEWFVRQIKETADKLLRDQTARSDVKLVNTALKEMRYAFMVFSAFKHLPKISVFGSARLGADHPAYQQAVAFGRLMAEAGYMVITGAASGIMEAGHVGAGRDKSIGVNILLPFEQGANPIIAGDRKLIHMKYFFTRKLMFVKESNAIALFPGGFGTLDEGFEALTLVQTGKSQMLPIVMVDEPGGDYWTTWHRYIQEMLLQRGMISPSDLALYKVTDDVKEAVAEVLTFYRVYHSMRYVNNQLVLRLRRRLTNGTLQRIRAEFTDILDNGTFEQTDALPEEMSDPHLLHLPRLVFHFNRRAMGRLRMLIDVINRDQESE